MNKSSAPAALLLGALIALGLGALGYQLADGLLRFKALDRTVSVKGLAEREVPADTAIWPIKFSEADNDLGALYATLQRKNALISEFLQQQGFGEGEIGVSAPAIIDRQAQSYGDASRAEFRFTGSSTITVYSGQVERVRSAIRQELDRGGQIFYADAFEISLNHVHTHRVSPALK